MTSPASYSFEVIHCDTSIMRCSKGQMCSFNGCRDIHLRSLLAILVISNVTNFFLPSDQSVLIYVRADFRFSERIHGSCVMPRRIGSDEDESRPRKKKTSTTQKIKKPPAKTHASSSRAKSVPNGGGDSVISAWAKRRTVESLDGIEDVESVSPQREWQKPKFDIDDGKLPAIKER